MNEGTFQSGELGCALALAATVALSFLAAGCGGGSASSASRTASPSVRLVAATTAYLQARTQMLVRDTPADALRDVYAPTSSAPAGGRWTSWSNSLRGSAGCVMNSRSQSTWGG